MRTELAIPDLTFTMVDQIGIVIVTTHVARMTSVAILREGKFARISGMFAKLARNCDRIVSNWKRIVKS
jgi:hypothetical protein